MSSVAIEVGKARCELRRQFWSDNKWPVEFLEAEGDPLNSKAKVVLTDPLESPDWFHRTKKFTQGLQRIEFTDSIWQDHGKFWPKALYPTALHDLVVRVGQKLDTRAWAYVAGVGPWARLAVTTAFDLGYRKVRIISNDHAGVEDLSRKIQKFCFGIELEELATADVTLQPNNGSLLINTFDLETDKDMLTTLLYLNFVRRPALIVDVPFHNALSPLLQEGQHAGFEVISGVDLRGMYDFMVLEKLGIKIGINWSQYLTTWRAALELLRDKPAEQASQPATPPVTPS